MRFELHKHLVGRAGLEPATNGLAIHGSHRLPEKPVNACTTEAFVLPSAWRDQSLTVAIDVDSDSKGRFPAMQIELIPEQPIGGARMESKTRIPKLRDGHGETTFDPLSPGAYQIRVFGSAQGTPVTPVTTTVLVWAPDLTGPSPA
jgi:hypothetical protein